MHFPASSCLRLISMLIKNCAVAGTVWNLLVEELLRLVLRLTGHVDAELLKGVCVDLG